MNMEQWWHVRMWHLSTVVASHEAVVIGGRADVGQSTKSSESEIRISGNMLGRFAFAKSGCRNG
jgi:hypothetical protein